MIQYNVSGIGRNRGHAIRRIVSGRRVINSEKHEKLDKIFSCHDPSGK